MLADQAMDQSIGMAGLGFHPHHLVARVASTDEVNRMVLRACLLLESILRPRASVLSPPRVASVATLSTARGCSGINSDGQRRELPPPRPVALDFEHQRPAQEGAHQYQPSKEAEARKSKVDRYGLYNIRSNQHFEAEQQRSADAYSVLIVMMCRSPTDITISRPGDACDKNEHTENLDAGTDEPDPVASGGFKGG